MQGSGNLQWLLICFVYILHEFLVHYCWIWGATSRCCRPWGGDTTGGCRPWGGDTTGGCRPWGGDTTRCCRLGGGGQWWQEGGRWRIPWRGWHLFHICLLFIRFCLPLLGMSSMFLNWLPGFASIFIPHTYIVKHNNIQGGKKIVLFCSIIPIFIKTLNINDMKIEIYTKSTHKNGAKDILENMPKLIERRSKCLLIITQLLFIRAWCSHIYVALYGPFWSWVSLHLILQKSEFLYPPLFFKRKLTRYIKTNQVKNLWVFFFFFVCVCVLLLFFYPESDHYHTQISEDTNEWSM